MHQIFGIPKVGMQAFSHKENTSSGNRSKRTGLPRLLLKKKDGEKKPPKHFGEFQLGHKNAHVVSCACAGRVGFGVFFVFAIALEK